MTEQETISLDNQLPVPPELHLLPEHQLPNLPADMDFTARDIVNGFAEAYSGFRERVSPRTALGVLGASATLFTGLNMLEADGGSQVQAGVVEYVDVAVDTDPLSSVIDIPLPTPETLPPLSWIPDSVNRWQPLIEEISEEVELSEELEALVPLILIKESMGNESAINPTSRAMGLGQIMPHMVGAIQEKYGYPSNDDLMNPETNLRYSITLLKEISERMKTRLGVDEITDEVILGTAAGYNNGTKEELIVAAGSSVFSTSETQSYADDVLAMWQERFDDHSPTFNRISS